MQSAARAAACFAVLASLPCFAWAATGATVPADPHIGDVLEIVAYRWDAADGRFSAQSTASAVNLGGGKLLTNAHAVSDENGRLADGLVACRATDWDAQPDCDWTLNIERTDSGADLALVSAQTPADWGSGVVLSSVTPALGDDVDVYGFPGNGGGTITVTRGRVAGTDGDSGWLKTDASIDAGNSGGAAFGSGGKLVGVPVAVRIGYSTLGYLIPASQARDFLDANGSAVVRDARITAAFAAWYGDLKRRKEAKTVSDAGLLLRNFGAFGFSLTDLDRALGGKISQYRFATDDGNTQVAISATLKSGKVPDLTAQGKKQLKQSWKAVASGTNVKLGGRVFDGLTVVAGPLDEDSPAVILKLRSGNAVISISQERPDGPQLRQAVALAAATATSAKDSGAPTYGPVTFVIPTGGGTVTALDARWNVARTFFWADGAVATFAVRDLGAVQQGTLKEFAYGMRKGLVSTLEGDLTALTIRATHSGTPYVEAKMSDAQGRLARAYVYLWTDKDGEAWAGILTAAAGAAGVSLEPADRFASWTQVSSPCPFSTDGVVYGADLLPTAAK